MVGKFYSCNVAALLFTVAPVLAGEVVPVRKNEEMRAYIDGMAKEIVSTWSVELSPEGDGRFAYLLSPSQRVSQYQPYCYRVGLVVWRGEDHAFVPLFNQAQTGNVFYQYALNQKGVACDALNQQEYFHAVADGDGRPHLGLLDMAKKIMQRPWLQSISGEVNEITYQDAQSKACLSLEKLDTIKLRSIGMEANDGGRYFVAEMLCDHDKKSWQITLSIDESSDRKTYRYSSRGIEASVLECARTERCRAD